MQQSDGSVVELTKKQAVDLENFLKKAPGAIEELTIGDTRFFRPPDGNKTVPKMEEPTLNRHARRKLAKTGLCGLADLAHSDDPA